ncbi:MAG: hypothetical protein ACREMJ_12595 [Gemmatimonadales bacterium]
MLTAIADSMDVGDNTAYHERLLFYKGRRDEAALRAQMATDDLQAATVGYGLANWYLARGDSARARAQLQEIVRGDYWPAFGFIAAEADLLRMR